MSVSVSALMIHFLIPAPEFIEIISSSISICLIGFQLKKESVEEAKRIKHTEMSNILVGLVFKLELTLKRMTFI